MKSPKEGTNKYKQILKIGCWGEFDYFGDFNCNWNYEWDCEYCPIVIEEQRNKSIDKKK